MFFWVSKFFRISSIGFIRPAPLKTVRSAAMQFPEINKAMPMIQMNFFIYDLLTGGNLYDATSFLA
jgi:hypothetical protein